MVKNPQSSYVYRGKKAEILPHVGKDLWGGIGMLLGMKRKLDSFLMWGKDLQGRIAVHLRGRNLKLLPLLGRFCREGKLCIQ